MNRTKSSDRELIEVVLLALLILTAILLLRSSINRYSDYTVIKLSEITTAAGYKTFKNSMLEVTEQREHAIRYRL